MTETITIPYSGHLLVSQLAGYGLAFALDAAGVETVIGHDPESQSFEPVVAFDGDLTTVARAIRGSAVEAEHVVEADIDPGRTGNDRRAVIWSRASFANDLPRAAHVLGLRAGLLDATERADERVAQGLLAGLGAPATWGPGSLKPSDGATQLDGVLGNHTSDLVRGVLRPARAAVSAIDAETLDRGWWANPSAGQMDKTGWAPPGTPVDLVHQWLAVLGLAVLPVAHRPLDASRTPACWTRASPRRRGVTLPLVASPVTLHRLRGLLALRALTEITGEPDESDAVAVDELCSFGIGEVVVYERQYRPGSGSSVAFTYRRGRRVALS